MATVEIVAALLADVPKMIAVVAGVLALVLLFKEAAYLRRGYIIEVTGPMPFSKGERSSLVSEAVFPEWRKAATLLLALGLIVDLILLLASQHRVSFLVLFMTFAGALGLSYNDVTRYGTLGAPMSWKTLSLLAAVLIAAVRAY
jgi:hypothetical protein